MNRMRGYSEAAEDAWLNRQIDRHNRDPEPAEPDCEPEEREPDERPIIHTLKRP